MASGRPTVSLRSIFQQAPDFFQCDVEATDKREVVLPFNKVLEQFTAFQVRSDQMGSDSVPQLETPFLKMTIEDGQRFGTPVAPVPSSARYCRRHPKSPPFRLDQSIRVRLPLPDQAETQRRRWHGSGIRRARAASLRIRRGLRKFHRTEWACPPLREFQPQVGRPFQPLRLRLFRRRRLESRSR